MGFPMRLLTLLVLIVGYSGASATLAAESDVGIVLIHGKWGNPSSGIAVLSQALTNKGYRVSTPIMPWSDQRNYDADYPTALAEIENSAQALRQQGAKKILVGGHSFGANAAIAYAGSGREVDGILAIAPGHVPDLMSFRNALGDSVTKARQMISDGKGNEADTFDDLNQGQLKSIHTRANIYLSYFDPEGMGAMPLNAAKLKRPVPLLWVVGNTDTILKQGEAYVFNRIPPHPHNKYLIIEGTHKNTPTRAATHIVEWIASLGY